MKMESGKKKRMARVCIGGEKPLSQVSLYLSVRDASRLPFGWQKHTTHVRGVQLVKIPV